MEILYDLGLVLGIFFASFFGVISGGAGLVTRPLLIFIGLPAQVAIGTARVANLGARFVGIPEFHKHKKIDWKLAFILLIPSAIGGIIGTQIVASLDNEILTKLTGFMVIFFGLLLLIKKEIGVTKSEKAISTLKKVGGLVLFTFTNILGTIAGGGGTLNSYALIFMYNKTYISSAAIRKVAGYSGSIISSILFINLGFVNWYYVLLTFIGSGLGGYFGVKYGIKKGESWVRKLMLIVVAIIGLRMLFF